MALCRPYRAARLLEATASACLARIPQNSAWALPAARLLSAAISNTRRSTNTSRAHAASRSGPSTCSQAEPWAHTTYDRTGAMTVCVRAWMRVCVCAHVHGNVPLVPSVLRCLPLLYWAPWQHCDPCMPTASWQPGPLPQLQTHTQDHTYTPHLTPHDELVVVVTLAHQTQESNAHRTLLIWLKDKENEPNLQGTAGARVHVSDAGVCTCRYLTCRELHCVCGFLELMQAPLKRRPSKQLQPRVRRHHRACGARPGGAARGCALFFCGHPVLGWVRVCGALEKLLHAQGEGVRVAHGCVHRSHMPTTDMSTRFRLHMHVHGSTTCTNSSPRRSCRPTT